MGRHDLRLAAVVIAASLALLPKLCLSAEQAASLSLRLWSIPDTNSADPRDAANAQIIELFKQRHPGITLRKTAGIQIPQIGASAALLMSIAGGVAPDVMELSQDNLYSFVQQGFLVPL